MINGQRNRIRESDVKEIGGLSQSERRLRGLPEMMDLAVPGIRALKAAVNRGYGAREWLEKAEMACQRVREANSETALGFLLRKGVQTLANDWYQASPAMWRDYCGVASSTTVAEWYAPLYPSTLPDKISRGQRYPESRIIGEDSVLVNQKFGLIVAFERELFDDDQTGQIAQRSQHLGSSMGITESVYTSSRFLGAARTYANITVSASTYSTTDVNGTAVTTPWSTTIYGSTGNRPSTYGILNVGHLKEAYVALLNAVDPLNNKLVINPNVLLVSAQDALNGQILLAPGQYPAVIGQSSAVLASNPVLGASTSAAGANQGVLAGFPGGIGSNNPFSGLGWKLVIERYLKDWAWALGEKGKGFVFQERTPMELIQEAPNSGSMFAFDVIQYRVSKRFEVDWIAGGSRFWYLGNSGDVSGVQ